MGCRRWWVMRPDGWYPDPARSHELRYFDHEHWTAFVSDHGLVAVDESASPRRRRWPWVVGGLVAVVSLALGALGLVGLDRELDELDVFTADLTASSAGFPTESSSTTVRAWSPDGYRMAALVPDQVVAAGIRSPTSHTVLAVRVTAIPVDLSVGAEFGVQCWQSQERGYGLLVSSDGVARLVVGSVLNGEVLTMATARVEPLGAGRPVTLTLACDVIGDEAILAGYVGDTKVLTARPANSLSEITANGMVVWTGGQAPASWTVTAFERMGVHNMPAGWRD